MLDGDLPPDSHRIYRQQDGNQQGGRRLPDQVEDLKKDMVGYIAQVPDQVHHRRHRHQDHGQQGRENADPESGRLLQLKGFRATDGIDIAGTGFADGFRTHPFHELGK